MRKRLAFVCILRPTDGGVEEIDLDLLSSLQCTHRSLTGMLPQISVVQRQLVKIISKDHLRASNLLAFVVCD